MPPIAAVNMVTARTLVPWATQRLGAALGVTDALMASAVWTVTHASGARVPADGPRIGFALSAVLAVLGMVCALVMFPDRCPDRAASPGTSARNEGAPRR